MTGTAESLVTERRALLEKGNRLIAAARQLDEQGDLDAAEDAWKCFEELNRRYKALLSNVTVARCPESGVLVRWPIDTVDLDGWFWDYDAPSRYTPELPAQWLAMPGAVQLRAPVAPAPFLSRPGPGAPYVVPRILNAPGVRAVIAQVPVGPHLGWAISYFGPQPEGVDLENLWGTRKYDVYDDDGKWLGWNQRTPWPANYDFDLEPWIRSERLLWIAPGDDNATLRQDTEGCPYIGIDGPHSIPFIENGRVRYPSPS